MSNPEEVYVTRLREAVATLREVRRERDALLAGSAEPIAIVGMLAGAPKRGIPCSP